MTGCIALHDACKRLLAQFIVSEPDPLEAYARLGIAVVDGNFSAEEAAAIGKLIDLMHEKEAA